MKKLFSPVGVALVVVAIRMVSAFSELAGTLRACFLSIDQTMTHDQRRILFVSVASCAVLHLCLSSLAFYILHVHDGRPYDHNPEVATRFRWLLIIMDFPLALLDEYYLEIYPFRKLMNIYFIGGGTVMWEIIGLLLGRTVNWNIQRRANGKKNIFTLKRLGYMLAATVLLLALYVGSYVTYMRAFCDYTAYTRADGSVVMIQQDIALFYHDRHFHSFLYYLFCPISAIDEAVSGRRTHLYR